MEQKRRWKRMIKIFVLMAAIFSLQLSFAVSAADGEAEEGKEQFQSGLIGPDNIDTKGYDVVFCIDNSGSVWDQQEVRDQALRSIANLAVGSDIRIGGVYFAGKIYKKQKLTSMEDTEGSQKIIKEFLHLTEQDEDNRYTNIGTALEEAHALFEDQDSSRKRILILFSDGINEKSEKDLAYKKMADAETRYQVQLLGEDDIPIYCVYLQKKENDEDYLKDLVNYFDSSNSYDEQRFKKVTESQIYMLSEQFAQIFYSMQNDMKFKEISMDSSGEFGFYVPEMGVKKLQIYLKNDSSYEVELNPSDKEDDAEIWEDASNTYITVEDPTEGDWALKVSGDHKEDTRGTIAYYADLSAEVELVSEQEDDGKAYKNDPQKLKVCFYDKDANEIPANSVAEVSAVRTLRTEAGRVLKKEMQLRPAGNGYESEEFLWDEYGTYDLEIRVTYDDLLDLTYHIIDGQVVKRAPVVHDKNSLFWALGTGKGETFSLKKSELYSDPDGEEVDITGIVQINEENPVEVVEKGGFITVTAKSAGEVEFALNLEDTTGKTADVTIKGRVYDKLTMQIVVIVILIVALAVILLILLYIQKNKQVYQRMQKESKEFKKVYSQILGLYDRHQEKMKEAGQVESGLKNAFDTLRELCEGQLPEELRKEYADYLEADLVENKLRQIRKIEGEIKDKKEAIDIRKNQVESCVKEDGQKRIGYRSEQLRTYMKEINDTESYLREKIKVYADELMKVEDEAEEISQISCDLLALLEEPVRCDLEISYRDHIGAKVCKNLRGGFCLDEIQMLSADSDPKTLGDILCGESTGIYVFGYENEDEDAGLKLMSARTFKIRNASAGRDRHEKTAELLGGETYKITPDNMGVITIQVGEENKNVR